MNKIITLAQERGSTATTHAGAWRFLLAHLPAAIRGTSPSLYDRGSEALANYNKLRDEDRASRIMSALGLWQRDDIETEAAQLSAAYIRRNCSLLTSWPLKKSQASWAGGEHHTTIDIDAVPSATGWSTREWSSNKKWSGTDSHVRITATLGALSYFPSLQSQDGSIIIDAEKLGTREYRIVWVEQGRGFDLKTVSGYLVRGYHVKAVSINAARKKVAAARQLAVDTAIKSRLTKRQDRDYQARIAGVMVSVEDSIIGGNCPSGTQSEVSRIIADIGNIGGINATELLRRRNDMYTQRAVRAAYQRVYRNIAA